jgi:hypothetical protein
MFDTGMLALTLAVVAMATSGGAVDPAPKPECWMDDAPEFITILKTHINSTNKEGILDCSGQAGIVNEICQYSEDNEYDPGDTDIVIKWNECGIISFSCSSVHDDSSYVPGPLPAEVTDLDLTNGHMTGNCMDNTTVYAIAIAAIVGALAIIGLVIFFSCCRK